MNDRSVIVVGAGAAGLMVARELLRAGKEVLILEARDRIGGRIHTMLNQQFTIEAGAEFVHGHLPLTMELLNEYGISYYETGGEMVQIENGNLREREGFISGWDELLMKMGEVKTDMAFSDFLSIHFGEKKYEKLRSSVLRFAEGFDTADTNIASTLALYREWTGEEDESQYRIEGGYSRLTDALLNECLALGGSLKMSHTVKKIQWEKNKVEVCTHNGQEFPGNRIILTVPVNVLKAQHWEPAGIAFTPSPKHHLDAIEKMGFGSVIKMIYQFEETFWRQKIKNTGFIISDETIPTWWSQFPKSDFTLTGWLGGPSSKAFQQKTSEQISELAIRSLASIFKTDLSSMQSQITGQYVFNWGNDPFTLGSYSFPAIGSNEARKLLSNPVDNTLFFSGEALYEGSFGGSVEAALASGSDVAKKLLQS
jgi:monoamine oxidase